MYYSADASAVLNILNILFFQSLRSTGVGGCSSLPSAVGGHYRIPPLSSTFLPVIGHFPAIDQASRLPRASADKWRWERVFISKVVNCTKIDSTRFTVCLTSKQVVAAKF